MKDEFNQPKESFIQNDYSKKNEYFNVNEFHSAEEFHEDVEELFEEKPEIIKKDESKDAKKSLSLVSKIKKMGYLVSATLFVTVLTNAIDPEFSILKGIGTNNESIGEEKPSKEHGNKEPEISESPTNDPGTNEPGTYETVTDEPETTQPITQMAPKEGFPVLDNLWPSGDLLVNGAQGEEFIIFIIDDVLHYVYAGKAYTNVPIETIDGVSYDYSTNTLTLNNVNADQLSTNMMGNGFTIKLEGQNYINEIIIWGYYYGGSVTFTGDGYLMTSGNKYNNIGLYLKAECSNSCIMVDSGVILEIMGSDAAIVIEDTSEEKGIYCLAPSEVSGGELKEINASNGYRTFSPVSYDEEELAGYIYIGPPEG